MARQVFPKPPAPEPGGVEFSNRVTTRLHRSGTDPHNPICKGLGIKLGYQMVDSFDRVDFAVLEEMDSAGNSVGNTEITGFWTYDEANLKASAVLQAGVHTPSSVDGTRLRLRIKTLRKRILNGQFFVRDQPFDIVTANGFVTTPETPLIFLFDPNTDPGPYPITFAVSFFPSWNDEIMRQHGVESVALGNKVVKPYGGSLTVSASSSPAAYTLAETNIENAGTVSFDGTIDTDYVITFLFRSDFGSFKIAAGQVHISIRSIDPGTQIITATCPSWPCPPEGGGEPPEDPPDLPPPDDALDPPDEFIGEDISGRYVKLNITAMGIYADGTPVSEVIATLRGYEVITERNGQDFVSLRQLSGDQTESYTSTGIKRIDLNATLSEAQMVVAELSDNSVTPLRGHTARFMDPTMQATDVPAEPEVANVAYDFPSNTLTFDLNGFGDGTEVTAYVQSEVAVVADSSPQEIADVGIEVGPTRSQVYTSLGNLQSLQVTDWPKQPAAIVAWFVSENGTSTAPYKFADTSSDYGSVKQGPQFAFVGWNDDPAGLGTNMRINVLSTGNNSGDLTLHVALSQYTTQLLFSSGTFTVANATGLQDINVGQGFFNKAGNYQLQLEGEQGSSVPDYVNQPGGPA